MSLLIDMSDGLVPVCGTVKDKGDSSKNLAHDLDRCERESTGCVNQGLAWFFFITMDRMSCWQKHNLCMATSELVGRHIVLIIHKCKIWLPPLFAQSFQACNSFSGD